MSENPWISEIKGFPLVDWEAAALGIDGHPEASQPRAWRELIIEWMQSFCRLLGPAASILQSTHFVLAGTLSNKEHSRILKFLEERLAVLMKVLGPSAPDHYPGGIPLVLFPRRRQFDLYLHLESIFDDPEDQFEVARAGAAFVNRGYGHMIVPPDSLSENWQSALAHELGHALVCHYRLPLWLDEGVATTMDGDDYSTDKSPVRFWQEHGLGRFWDGSGFCDPEFQSQSYTMARAMFAEIWACCCRDPGRLFLFLRDIARYRTATEAAQRRIGLSLGQIAEGILGPGDWEPLTAG